MPKPDPCEYVRDSYGVPARVGMHVTLSGRPGIIQGATHHIKVQMAGSKHTINVHPADRALIYLNNDGTQAWPA